MESDIGGNMHNKKGVSLAMLGITIIIMSILAGVIVAKLDNNNPLDKANFAKMNSTVYTIRTALVKYNIEIIKAGEKDPKAKINEMLMEPTLVGGNYAGYKKLNLNSEAFKNNLDINYAEVPDSQNIERFGTFYVNPENGETVFELSDAAYAKYFKEKLPDGVFRPGNINPINTK